MLQFFGVSAKKIYQKSKKKIGYYITLELNRKNIKELFLWKIFEVDCFQK